MKIKTRYERMAQEMKNCMSEMNYFNFLLEALCGMFKWGTKSGADFPVEQRHLEEYLHCNAAFAVQESKEVPEGFLFAPEPCRDGVPDLDQFAEGNHVHAVTLGGGHEIDGYINETVVICYNNVLHTMDFNAFQYANYLASVDRAILVNTKLSGFAPILLATDSKNQKSLENMLQQLISGEVGVIKESEMFENLLQANQLQTASIDIVQPARISNVQYQSQLWYDFLRRFFSIYGIDIQTNNKRAQVTQDETNALDAFSWIAPLDMLHERQEFCKRANAVFGTDWTCEFSELWQTEYDKYKTVQEAGEDNETDNGEDSDGMDSGTEKPGDSAD